MGKLVKDNIDCKFFTLWEPDILLGPLNSFDIGDDKKFLVLSSLTSTIKLLDNSSGEIVAEYKGSHKST